MLPDILPSKHRSEGITIANFQVSLSDIPLFFLSFWSITEQFSAQTLTDEYKHHAERGFGVEQVGWIQLSCCSNKAKRKGSETTTLLLVNILLEELC